MTDIVVTLLVFSLFLLSNLYSPKNTAFFGFDYAYRCMGIYTPNPFWNATYLATRPFAIICFFETVKVLSEYERDFQWKNCVLFAVSLLLTTMTKPSYTMVVVPLIGLILLVQLIVSRGKSFRNAFCLCVTMIPTGIALLYQFSGIFTGTNAMGRGDRHRHRLCQSMEQLLQKHSFKYYHGNGIAHRRTFPESGI